MLKYNLALLAGSAIIFTGTLAVASMHFDNAPDPGESTQSTRKRGDMLVFYHGRAGYRQGGLSGRRGSLNNRTYRGGGLHGGK